MATNLPRKSLTGGISAALLLILSAVFANEGGYVDIPNDPGGATNHGITEKVARKHGYTGHMRDLQKHCTFPDEVCADKILTRDYVEKPGFMPLVDIDPAVAKEVIDTAVNMGPARPSRWFQKAVNSTCLANLTVDGQIGPATVREWKDCRANLGPLSCVSMLGKLDAYQSAEYDRLVRVNPKLRVFLKGWKAHRIGNVQRSECYQ